MTQITALIVTFTTLKKKKKKTQNKLLRSTLFSTEVTEMMKCTCGDAGSQFTTMERESVGEWNQHRRNSNNGGRPNTDDIVGP